MRERSNLILGLIFSIACLLAPPGFAQEPFSAFDVAVEIGFPPEPIEPISAEFRANFVPAFDANLDPAREIVDLRLFPPEPIVPPDPINPRPTDWMLLFAPGCFVEMRSGALRVRDFMACGIELSRFFDDGTSVDLTDRILNLEAKFMPPSSSQSEWRFRAEIELEFVPPEPVVPPEPIRGGVALRIGDDAGKAINSFVSWAGGQPPDDN